MFIGCCWCCSPAASADLFGCVAEAEEREVDCDEAAPEREEPQEAAVWSKLLVGVGETGLVGLLDGEEGPGLPFLVRFFLRKPRACIKRASARQPTGGPGPSNWAKRVCERRTAQRGCGELLHSNQASGQLADGVSRRGAADCSWDGTWERGSVRAWRAGGHVDALLTADRTGLQNRCTTTGLLVSWAAGAGAAGQDDDATTAEREWEWEGEGDGKRRRRGGMRPEVRDKWPCSMQCCRERESFTGAADTKSEQ